MKPEMSILGIDIAKRVFHVVVYPTTADIYFAPKPGTMPQLNPFWRGQGPGLTPFFLPTRSVSPHMALRPVAGHLV
jgi:hypothetical protein